MPVSMGWCRRGARADNCWVPSNVGSLRDLVDASGIEDVPKGSIPYPGQMYPAPLGLGKQPTDCGSSHFGSHSTTSGNSTVNAMVTKNTM